MSPRRATPMARAITWSASVFGARHSSRASPPPLRVSTQLTSLSSLTGSSGRTFGSPTQRIRKSPSFVKSFVNDRTFAQLPSGAFQRPLIVSAARPNPPTTTPAIATPTSTRAPADGRAVLVPSTPPLARDSAPGAEGELARSSFVAAPTAIAAAQATPMPAMARPASGAATGVCGASSPGRKTNASPATTSANARTAHASRGPRATNNATSAATSRPHGANPAPAGPDSNRRTSLRSSREWYAIPSAARSSRESAIVAVHGTSSTAAPATPTNEAPNARNAGTRPPATSDATTNASATTTVASAAGGYHAVATAVPIARPSNGRRAPPAVPANRPMRTSSRTMNGRSA